jgi:lysophospholipase L1-like esterase
MPVIFIGSSSIRMWSTLAKDMQPLPVMNMGFGGAKLNDVVYYAPRLVNHFNPSAVVIFAGSNDLQPNDLKSTEQMLQRYQAFVDSVRVDNPLLPIFYIAITPSPMRWEVWSEVQAVNKAIAEWSRNQTELFYIDTGPSLLNTDGVPDTELYLFDGLHLNAKGYRRWTEHIRPLLFAHPLIAQRL